MNCPNCGALMTLQRDRDYFYCAYCTTFHFPEADLDGVRVLDENPERIQCPLCKERLRRAMVDGIPALFCQKCRGLLMRQNQFGELVRMRRERAVGAGVRPQPLDPGELERILYCPVCGKKLDTHPYYGPGNIVIDVCSVCQVIWLDSGELRTIENAPGSDRGGQALHLHWRQSALKYQADQEARQKEQKRKRRP